MIFDIRTLMLMYFVINLISAGAIYSIWFQYQKRYPGIIFWLLNMSLQAIGSLLIMLRGVIPEFISIIFSNFIILLGATFLLIGLGKFIGKKIHLIANIVFFYLFLVAIIYFGLVHPEITMREILISAAIVFISSQSWWLLLYKADTRLRSETLGTGIIMAFFVIVSFLRIMFLMIFPMKSNDFFEIRYVDPISIALYVSLNVGLTICLILMVNRRLVRDVKENEEKFTITFNSSPYAILLIRTSDGRIIEANDGFISITGYKHEEVVGSLISDIELWIDEQNLYTIIKKSTDGKNMRGMEYKFRKKSGESFIGLLSAKIITINSEEFILSSISDINELSMLKQQLEESATHDSLTGLPNRILFNRKFDMAIQNAKKKGNMFAVLSLDIDNFKSVNDSYGHDMGDHVLIEISGRLSGVMRKNDILARFGGDEFVILLYQIDCKDDAIFVAERVLREFYKMVRIMDHDINLTVSVGIALFPENGLEMNMLIKKLDQSMY